MRTLLRNHPRIVRATLIVGGAYALPFFVLVTGFPAIVELLGAHPADAFGASIVGLTLMAILTPLFGALGDRIGRRPLLLLGFIGMAVLALPGIALLWDPSATWRVYTAQVLAIIPISMLAASVLVSLLEQYPRSLRGSGFGFFWAVAMAVFGGTGPMIATALAQRGVTFTITVYSLVMFIAAAIIVARSHETSFLTVPGDRSTEE